MEQNYILAKDVKSMTFAPFSCPAFISQKGVGPMRILGFLLVCGENYDDNCDQIGSIPVIDSGIVWSSMDGNNIGVNVFYPPLKRGSVWYKNILNDFLADEGNGDENCFVEECNRIGLTIID